MSTVQLYVVEIITPSIDIVVFDVARPSKKVEAARSNANQKLDNHRCGRGV